MRLTSPSFTQEGHEEEKQCLNSELWHACAGPLVSLPVLGSRVVYFPQGHSEQVAASTNKEIDTHIPNYPNLPPQLICLLHNVTMHADVETDEVYAQMTLQPLSPQEQKDAYLPAELSIPSKQPTNYFCKTLTASDTSTHGGFSVPRRAAEKVFPPLDFSQQPPAQELIARDLHDNEWKFRHIFRGQPKRHLLTTGWSVFVSAKRLNAGDSVLFIWNDKNQLLLGIRRANRSQNVMPSSVLSTDSMHIGLLAAAAHAAATSSRFTIFYNPRSSLSEFVIPLAKYAKAVYHTRISVGMRFRMLFETEESSVRRYMGTITGISDLDPVRWPSSHWRSVKVGWDESTAGERQPRVSLWEIEPLTTFPLYPTAFPLRLKRPWPPGITSFHGSKEGDLGMNSPVTWFRGDEDRGMQSLNFQEMGVSPWMQPTLDASMLGLQPDMYQAMASAALQEMRNADASNQIPASLLQFQQPQSVSNISALMQQILPHSQPPQNFPQSIQPNQIQAQSQTEVQAQVQAQIQQQLQQRRLFNDKQSQQQQQQFSIHQHIPNSLSALSQFTSHPHPHPQTQSPSLQTISSLGQRQNFSDSNGTSVISSSAFSSHSLMHNTTSDLLRLPRTNELIPSSDWVSRHASADCFLSPGASQCLVPKMEPSSPQHANASSHSVSLPPFPGGEFSMDQTDPHNHVLFGSNIDDSSSILLENGISRLRGVGSESDSTTMPFADSDFLSGACSDFPLNPTITPSSCLDETSFLQTSEDVGQVNPPTRTFVKVYKTGSFGRSLDITKFSSYQELRSELAHMFGLEAQLEDPRSGWQLVFVDRENDILLLGDDPWQEFVNSVWCIKILSPQDVQQMGKDGQDIVNSRKRFSSEGCDDSVNRRDSRNLGNGMNFVRSLD